jgi:hypothetical protein
MGGCRYVKLMLNRIKWHAIGDGEGGEGEDDDDDDDDDDYEAGAKSRGPGGKCELVWQGTVPKAAFTSFKFQVGASPAWMDAMMPLMLE